MDFIQKVFITIFVEEIFVFIPLTAIFFYSIFNLIEKKFSSISFFVLLLPFFFIFYQYSYLPNFFSSIGQDSLTELNADLGEAIFYIKTFFSFLLDPEIFKRNRFWLLLFSSLLTGASIYFLIKYNCKKLNKNILELNKYLTSVFILFLILGFYKILTLTFTSLEAGRDLKVFENEFRKNIENYKVNKKTSNTLATVIYVGESTSALNMSLYGYPFETTPWLNSLKNDKKLIKFNSAFATHTHTTPSLLSAFSLCIKQKKENCSLNLENKKENLSTVDIFNKSNINTILYSTQGSLGGHNLANRLMFNTKDKIFSTSENNHKKNYSLELMGNRFKPKQDDLKFFNNEFCKNKRIYKDKSSSLILLHSYAGHGQYNGYLDFISDKKLFKYPDYINKKNFLGKDHKNFRLINEYDTAINYIDSSLEAVFKCSINKFAASSQPLVFIYFSDHGESPATARGHDSSRLTYEMLHVPFLIYFNDVAYELYAEKFKRLKKLENQNLTLRFISDLMIFLYDIDILNIDNSIAYKSDEFKSLDSKFILGRKNLNNNISKLQTFWNYNNNKIEDKNFEENFFKQDTSINLWQLNNFLESRELTDRENKKNLVCKHRANSFINQYKASLSNGCFETDILFFEDKTLSAHEISSDTDLEFDDFLFSNYKKNTVWLDSKNVDKVKNCKFAYNWLNKNSKNFLNLLLEIPSSSINNIDNVDWKKCIQAINRITNIDVGYYMPTDKITSCSSKNQNNSKKMECKKNFNKINKFLEEVNINNITFDYTGYNAIENFLKFKKLKWHVWNIQDINSFNKILSHKNLGIILIANNKFSNNLN